MKRKTAKTKEEVNFDVVKEAVAREDQVCVTEEYE